MIKQHSIAILIQSSLLSFTLFSTAYAVEMNTVNNLKSPINWTGFYGGISMGINVNHVNVDSQHVGFTNANDACNTSANYSRFYPGLQLGYSQETNNNIVLGVEASATFNTNSSKKLTCDCSNTTMTVGDSFTFKNRRQASLIGRIGYLLEQYQFKALPFVAAGISYANLGLNYQNEINDYYSTNTNRMGWRLGAGVDWALREHWSIRAEYFYIDYGKAVDLNIPTVYTVTDPNGQANARLNSNYLGLALNYWA